MFIGVTKKKKKFAKRKRNLQKKNLYKIILWWPSVTYTTDERQRHLLQLKCKHRKK